MTSSRDIARLLEIMAALRTPGSGCPWDLEQNFATIAPYTIEEAYEVADAIARDDLADLRDELGDLLLQVVFHARMAQEQGAFDFGDVVQGLTEKLVRRHPHVFGAAEGVDTAGKVLEQWEQIKSREQTDAGQKRALLSGVPRAMPALLRAHEIGTRVAAVGFEWARAEDVIDKIEEEVAELREAVAREGRERAEEEMGDLLFAIANLARKLGIEPESALRKANEKFTARFGTLEGRFEQQGRSVHEATLEEMEEVWEEVKEEG
jgi:nucleoside triphosphate diphosphatase